MKAQFIKVITGLCKVLVLSCIACGPSLAAYPEKPIKIIDPFPAGGATDVLARIIGKHLSDKWGQPVIVENRPGAGGNIGAAAGAKAQPDGYTLTMTAAGIVAVNPHVYSNLPYDSIEDFVHITQLVNAPLLLAVHPSLQVSNIHEYIDLLKSKPGSISVANGGVGTAQHLGAEYIDLAAGTKALHVPYKGSVPATSDAVGGQTGAILDNMVLLVQHVQKGALKPLAVTTKTRADVLPDVPTLHETVLPEFETSTWYGIAAPRGTPDTIIDQLHGAIIDAMSTPSVHKMLIDQGLQPVGNTPEEFLTFIRNAHDKAGRIVKEANISLE